MPVLRALAEGAALMIKAHVLVDCVGGSSQSKTLVRIRGVSSGFLQSMSFWFFMAWIYSFIESQNHQDWKRPLRSRSPTIHQYFPLTLSLSTTSKCLLNPFKECVHHLPGQPVPSYSVFAVGSFLHL